MLIRQRGLAMVYGLFVLSTGFVVLFFLFNTGQLISEKTKLVNTADAVAYSAGILHARALNFDAYTNRALMANEVMIAQTVSVASWIKYAQGHIDNVPPLNCYQVVYSVPFWMALAEYLPLCIAASYPPAAVAVGYARSAFDVVGETTVRASELSKLNLQLAQSAMVAALLPARSSLMREVADANYRNDGKVKVDTLPLTDNFTLFDGAPFIALNTGNDRSRFKEAELTAAYKDDFVRTRTWDSHSPWPCLLAPRGDADRSGATQLEGYDDWKASDRAGLKAESMHLSFTGPKCKTDAQYPLGDGAQSARDWGYTGVPNFYDLSAKALAYGPDHADAAKRDPRLKFAIRLTRATGETKTSAGRSLIKPSGTMEIYQGSQAGGEMAAVATSEVYFERATARADGATELASLFNPYWQVHLVGNSTATVAAAIALQTGAAR